MLVCVCVYVWCAEVQQDRQCMYNITFRRVRSTIVAVVKQ